MQTRMRCTCGKVITIEQESPDVDGDVRVVWYHGSQNVNSYWYFSYHEFDDDIEQDAQELVRKINFFISGIYDVGHRLDVSI